MKAFTTTLVCNALVERSIPRVGLSAHASNRHPALKNEVYRVPAPDVVLEAPEMSRDGAVRRGEAAPQRALGLVPAQARGWRVGAIS